MILVPCLMFSYRLYLSCLLPVHQIAMILHTVNEPLQVFSHMLAVCLKSVSHVFAIQVCVLLMSLKSITFTCASCPYILLPTQPGSASYKLTLLLLSFSFHPSQCTKMSFIPGHWFGALYQLTTRGDLSSFQLCYTIQLNRPLVIICHQLMMLRSDHKKTKFCETRKADWTYVTIK